MMLRERMFRSSSLVVLSLLLLLLLLSSSSFIFGVQAFVPPIIRSSSLSIVSSSREQQRQEQHVSDRLSLFGVLVPQQNQPRQNLYSSMSSDYDDVDDDADYDNDFDDDDDDDIYYSVVTDQMPLGSGLSDEWKVPNDFTTFLNQCTIQSFLFLLKTCRDPQTVLWVENYTKPIISHPTSTVTFARSKNTPQRAGITGSGASLLLSYHGLAAFNITKFPTWESYFTQLLDGPRITYIIESGQKHIPEYELDINPVSLCSRMLSVREQIAREFTYDLQIISTMGNVTMQSYWEKVRPSSEKQQQPQRPPSGTTGNARLLFLELNPSSDSDYAPSPLRNGNFDLLLLLCTQEAIHRVLNNKDNYVGPSSSSSASSSSSGNKERSTMLLSLYQRRYLLNFYTSRLRSHFTGRQFYGRADQFIEELLQSRPVIIPLSNDDSRSGSSSSSGKITVDPVEVAERILQVRTAIALEWKYMAATVPDNHLAIKRIQFDRLLQSYSSQPASPQQLYDEVEITQDKKNADN